MSSVPLHSMDPLLRKANAKVPPGAPDINSKEAALQYVQGTAPSVMEKAPVKDFSGPNEANFMPFPDELQPKNNDFVPFPDELQPKTEVVAKPPELTPIRDPEANIQQFMTGQTTASTMGNKVVPTRPMWDIPHDIAKEAGEAAEGLTKPINWTDSVPGTFVPKELAMKPLYAAQFALSPLTGVLRGVGGSAISELFNVDKPTGDTAVDAATALIGSLSTGPTTKVLAGVQRLQKAFAKDGVAAEDISATLRPYVLEALKRKEPFSLQDLPREQFPHLMEEINTVIANPDLANAAVTKFNKERLISAFPNATQDIENLFHAKGIRGLSEAFENTASKVNSDMFELVKSRYADATVPNSPVLNLITTDKKYAPSVQSALDQVMSERRMANARSIETGVAPPYPNLGNTFNLIDEGQIPLDIWLTIRQKLYKMGKYAGDGTLTPEARAARETAIEVDKTLKTIMPELGKSIDEHHAYNNALEAVELGFNHFNRTPEENKLVLAQLAKEENASRVKPLSQVDKSRLSNLDLYKAAATQGRIETASDTNSPIMNIFKGIQNTNTGDAARWRQLFPEGQSGTDMFSDFVKDMAARQSYLDMPVEMRSGVLKTPNELLREGSIDYLTGSAEKAIGKGLVGSSTQGKAMHKVAKAIDEISQGEKSRVGATNFINPKTEAELAKLDKNYPGLFKRIVGSLRLPEWITGASAQNVSEDAKPKENK